MEGLGVCREVRGLCNGAQHGCCIGALRKQGGFSNMGDYAELDREVKALHRAKRQAGIASWGSLVFVLMAQVFGLFVFFEALSMAVVVPAKASRSSRPIAVNVSDRADQIANWDTLERLKVSDRNVGLDYLRKALAIAENLTSASENNLVLALAAQGRKLFVVPGEKRGLKLYEPSLGASYVHKNTFNWIIWYHIDRVFKSDLVVSRRYRSQNDSRSIGSNEFMTPQLNGSLQLNPLIDGDPREESSSNDEPKGVLGELLRVDRKLLGVFGELPVHF